LGEKQFIIQVIHEIKSEDFHSKKNRKVILYRRGGFGTPGKSETGNISNTYKKQIGMHYESQSLR
jgi:hypothetical protein